MARASRRRAAKTGVTVDFTGVEAGGGGFKIKEGDYLMEVEKVEDTESDAGNSMFKWTFIGKEGAAKGKKFFLYTVYDPPDSLWKLRSLLEALGQEVPDGPMDIDTEELVGLEIIGQVGDEEYQNKITSKLQDFSSVDAEEAGEEEPEPASRRGAKKGAAKKKSKKELEAVSAEEVKAMDDEEMADLVEKYDLEVDLDKQKTPRRKASAIITALEDKELLADD
jgi:hypothetical protein